MLIKFTKPENLDGGKLIDELAAVGIKVNTKTSPRLDGNGDFWLDIDEDKAQAAEAIIAAHNG
jgi:hypothetical protein